MDQEMSIPYLWKKVNHVYIKSNNKLDYTEKW